MGTFQYAAASGDRDVLRALADHAIARHLPAAAGAARARTWSCTAMWSMPQAELVARWMLVGFVHGVMNTDNMTISGETIDYGPCAFMDAFDPATVFSSIDDRGRYAYGNQPAVAQWNLARLGEALLPLIDEDADAAVEAATAVLGGFAEAYERHWAEGMAAKLGLTAPDRELATDLLELMRRSTSTSPRSSVRSRPAPRGRCSPSRSRSTVGRAPRGAAAGGPGRCGGGDGPGQPRLHPAQPPRGGGARRGDGGDMAPFHRLVDVVSRPYRRASGPGELCRARAGWPRPSRHLLRHLRHRSAGAAVTIDRLARAAA